METIQKKTPLLRFSMSSQDWKRLRYGDIFSFYTTNSFSRDMLNYEEGIVNNIHYGDIHTKFSTLFDISKENVPYVNKDIDITKIKDDNYCKVGDLVIADASEDYYDVGKTIEIINLDNKKVLAGLHTFLARPKNNYVALGFTGYLLQSWNVRKQVMTIAQGSKVLSLSYNRLSQINLSIPSIPEQQKIASFFTLIDAKIDQLSRKKELLEQYRKEVVQQLFSQKIRFKDDKGNSFDNWVVKKLKDITILITKGTTPTSLGYNYIDIGVNFIKVESISKNGVIDIDLTPKISNECNEALKRSSLKSDDIIFSIAGTLGRTAIIKEKDLPANTNQALAIIRLKKDCNLSFINISLNTKDIEKYIIKMVSVGAQPNLNLDQIGNIKINIPSSGEQIKIANFISAIDAKINHTTTQLNKTKEFKKGLLQQMFV